MANHSKLLAALDHFADSLERDRNIERRRFILATITCACYAAMHAKGVHLNAIVLALLAVIALTGLLAAFQTIRWSTALNRTRKLSGMIREGNLQPWRDAEFRSMADEMERYGALDFYAKPKTEQVERAM